MRTPKIFRWTAWLALAVVVALGPAGCSRQDPATVEIDPTVRSYTVEGKITAMPDPEFGLPDIAIRHEAVPNFVDAYGEVVGMKAMLMPFPLGEGVSVEGLQSGDQVRFTFEVDFQREGLKHYITQIEKIDDSEAAPPDPATEPAHAHDHAAGPHDPHGHHHAGHSDHTGTVHKETTPGE